MHVHLFLITTTQMVTSYQAKLHTRKQKFKLQTTKCKLHTVVSIRFRHWKETQPFPLLCFSSPITLFHLLHPSHDASSGSLPYGPLP